MRSVTLLIVAATLAFAGSAEAQSKKKKKAQEKPPAAAKFKPVGGPLPPLPQPTELSLSFDVVDDDTFALEVSEETQTGQLADTLAWRIEDWRRQLKKDVQLVRRYRDWFARTLEKAQRDDFPVAVRHLRTVFASAQQLAVLAEQTMAEFDETYPADRDQEIALDPPEASRRVRLYLDKVNVMAASSRAFLARTVQGKQEKIVRIQ